MKICSVAHALPSRLVTNDELVESISTRHQHSMSPSHLSEASTFLRRQLDHAGAVKRYHRGADEKALDMGLTAARRALEQANLPAEAIDLLIFGGVGRGYVEPATANVFQRELRLTNATCFDILDACASWLRAVDVAHHLLKSGAYRRAMILNCEMNFREYEPTTIASPEELELLWSGFTVGEAATATIITDDEVTSGYRVTFRNSGDHVRNCQIPLPHAAQFQNGDYAERAALRFYARPEALARGAVRMLNEQYWSDPELSSLQFDIVFGHTVSVPVSQSVIRVLKLDPTLYYDLFPDYGNVVSASLPLAMSLAREEGRLQRGQRVLLIMGGAGMTTALGTFVY